MCRLELNARSLRRSMQQEAADLARPAAELRDVVSVLRTHQRLDHLRGNEPILLLAAPKGIHHVLIRQTRIHLAEGPEDGARRRLRASTDHQQPDDDLIRAGSL